MTVLAVQVAAGEFPEPYHGMNLRNLPGIAAYNIGESFRLRLIIGTWRSILTESIIGRMCG